MSDCYRLRFFVSMLAVMLTAPVLAQEGVMIFKDADLKLGQGLIKEHRCAECHARKFGGDGSGVYRPMQRVNTAGALRGMVEQCNTELNLGLFPEEVTAVAAVLNKEHYKFK